MSSGSAVLSAASAGAAHTDVLCAHCGLPVPAGLVSDLADRQFCCPGCHTAFDILHAVGLEKYYGLSERPGAAVTPTGRAYEEFDHPTFQSLYVRSLPGGLAEVELYLEGVHCASCVWLVERMPMIVPGVASAELQVRRSLARVVWNPAAVALSQIARSLDTLGYAPHPFRGAERETLRRREDRAMLARIGLAGAVAINVMLAALALYSGGGPSGIEPQYERFFRWISFALVTPSMFWPGRVFFSGAWSALKTRTLHMDVPIALGLAAGYLRGAVNTLNDTGPIYFDGLATLIFALLVGRYLQQRGQRAAADGAELLYSLTPTSARVVEPTGEEHDIPAEAIIPGATLSVRPGETFPADGVIVRGRSQLDLSLLTGESRPVSRGEGERVFAGTVNMATPLHVCVEQSGEATRVAKILRQVEESAARRAPIVEAANRVAMWFVGVVLVLAVVTYVLWRGDPMRAIDNAIALLVVTCPCALALSTPLAVSMAVGRAARAGIFVKGGDALERLSKPGRIFLDKTGTLTEGRTALVEWHGEDWVKPLVLALESESTHPIAAGFRRAWPAEPFTPAHATTHVLGGGIVGRVARHSVIVGSPRFVADQLGISESVIDTTQHPALTPVIVAVDGEIVASAWLGDPLRADAKDAVRALRASGWQVGILSGDAPSVVSAIGREIGLPDDACIGGASPETKRDVIESAVADGRTVVMVGDGINDAAAIAAASVGIGVHGGAEACLATADVYLTVPGLSRIVDLMNGARGTMRIIGRNIAFSIVYNAIGAGLAMAGVLSPLVAAILMPASSLTVVFASWRGRTFSGDAR